MFDDNIFGLKTYKLDDETLELHRDYDKEEIEVTTLGSSTREFISSTSGKPHYLEEPYHAYGVKDIPIGVSELENIYKSKVMRVVKDMGVFEEKEVHITMNSYNINKNQRAYTVVCSDKKDLSQEHILKSISSIKGKLMMQCAPMRLERIECIMTPEVKKNIVQASKKLSMYGKHIPIIARFDDYGRRLPDEIRIDTMKGMIIKIVDPETYGELHFELKGIIYRDTAYYRDIDTPF